MATHGAPPVLTQVALIGAGGFAGAIARFLVGQLVTARLGVLLPYGTLVVNASGCFLLGLVLGSLAGSPVPSPSVRALVATGFLGAYTTFSTFGVETVLLVEEGSALLAVVYVIASIMLGLGATVAGLALGRWLA